MKPPTDATPESTRTAYSKTPGMLDGGFAGDTFREMLDDKLADAGLTKIANCLLCHRLLLADCITWRTPTPCCFYRKTCTTRSKTPAEPQR